MLLRVRSLRLPASSVPLLAGALLAGCGGGSDDSSPVFTVRTTQVAVASSTPLVVSGRWIAFLADEASSGNTDFNGDGDSVDSIAYVVNAATRVETNLQVAARELAWLGDQLFLVVDESLDGRDWGGAPGTTERVLLRWSFGAALQFVDVLSSAGPRSIVQVGNLLFYAAAQVPVGATATSLRVIERTDPGNPREVLSDDLVGPLSPRILGAEGGIVFLALNEPAEGRDLNGDGDSTDVAVLALLDGQGSPVGIGYDRDVLNTGLAMASVSQPLRAREITGGGRAVGLLVNEAAQGNTNLNSFGGNPLPDSWRPPHCPSHDDGDTLDDVLHYVLFDSWQTNPATPNVIVNTGICGADRILMTAGAVGALSPEAMQGTCSLNGDGDQLDTVLRWIRFGAGQIPVREANRMLAVDTALAGPAEGAAELAGRFVIQVDEAADGRDWDGLPGTNRKLVGWIDPTAANPTWTFDHNPSPTLTSFVTSTWMGETPTRTRLGLAFAESSNDQDLNGDGDKADSVPTFARIDTSQTTRLVFPGVAFAVQKTNAGIDVINGWAFYRISEAEDGRDWTSSGGLTAFVALATNLTSGQTIYLGPLNDLPRRAVEGQPDGAGGAAAFLVSEAFAGDLNGDGDALDLVVRYIAF